MKKIIAMAVLILSLGFMDSTSSTAASAAPTGDPSSPVNAITPEECNFLLGGLNEQILELHREAFRSELKIRHLKAEIRRLRAHN